MLAYAAQRPLVDRCPHPNAMLLIIGAHVALLAAAMSAKMELPVRPPPLITKVGLIPLPKAPPPNPARTPHPLSQPDPWIDRTQPQVRLGPIQPPIVDPGPASDPGESVGSGTGVTPEITHPVTTPATSGPQLITPAADLKPPYPASKLLSEEEAVLRLKLTINEQGRVIAVDPVGGADPAFLDAARRHLIAHWRYKPAIEDGRPVISTTFITLHFELDG